MSNDGKRVVYTADARGSMTLFMTSVAGGPSEKLADEGGWSFEWTPDDSKILFRKVHTTEVYSMDVRTREQKRFAV